MAHQVSLPAVEIGQRPPSHYTEFAEERFDNFARLAGVGVGTPDRHCPTAACHEEIVKLYAQASQLHTTLPADSVLMQFLRGVVSRMETHHGLARTLATLLDA